MSESLQTSKPPRNPVVDALRGLAILWIAALHIWQLSWLDHRLIIGGKMIDLNFLPTNGNLGVELFLFISGFGLFYAFAASHFSGNPSPRFGRFFKKRALRIVPAYLLVLGLTFFLFPEKLGNSRETLRSILAHLFFVHNLSVATFDTILGVVWIIGVIVQFYLLFPLLCKAFLKRPLVTFITLSGICLAYRIVITTFWLDGAFHYISQVPAFLDVFLFGMAAAYVTGYLNQHKEKLKPYSGYFAIFALFCLVLFWFFLKYANKYRFVYTNVFIWQTVNRFYLSFIFFLFTVSASFAHKYFIKIFANRLTLGLAAVSYPLFMWHQKIGRLLYDNHQIPSLTADPRKDIGWQLGFTLATFLLAIAVSTFFTYGFEQPVAGLGSRLSRKGLKPKAEQHLEKAEGP